MNNPFVSIDQSQSDVHKQNANPLYTVYYKHPTTVYLKLYNEGVQRGGKEPSACNKSQCTGQVRCAGVFVVSDDLQSLSAATRDGKQRVSEREKGEGTLLKRKTESTH